MARGRRNLLIYRTGQLGDTLVSMPAIQAIRRKFPDHRFALLTDYHPGRGYVSSWDVLGPAGWFDEAVFYAPGKGLRDKVKNGFSLLRKLRRLSPEYVFDLSQPVRSKRQKYRDRLFLKQLIGAACYKGPDDGICTANRNDGGAAGCEPEWRRLLRIAGEREISADFRIAVPAKEKAAFREIAAAKGLPADGEFLAVGPGSKMPAKRWPPERFAELGKLLLANFPRLHLLVLGGKGDEKLGNELCRTWGERSVCLAGELTVYGSAAALEKCAAFVGNDTGTMHLAAMAGKPCVALFSARDLPGQWYPYGSNHVILRHDTECAGCMLEECDKQNKCLNSIGVEDAFRALKITLEAATAR